MHCSAYNMRLDGANSLTLQPFRLWLRPIPNFDSDITVNSDNLEGIPVNMLLTHLAIECMPCAM